MLGKGYCDHAVLLIEWLIRQVYSVNIYVCESTM